MDLAEFQRCINLGLGRVILYLQKHSSEPYREAILYACLHNTTYDRQIEGGKGEYLYEIIRLSGQEAFYRQSVIEALKIAEIQKYNRDTSHLLDIVECFAKTGDKEARQLLYELFNTTIENDEYGFASRIIDIDGLGGFLYVVEKLIEFAPSNSEYFDDDYLLWSLEEIVDKQVVQVKLQELRTKNPKLDDYLKSIEKYRQRPKHEKKLSDTPAPKPNYAELKPSLKTWSVGDSSKWGREADEESLIRAAIDLEQETDPLILRKYLAIFRKIAYPRPPEALFPLTDHKDVQIAAMTFGALKQMQNRSVREFALQEIAKERNIGRAISLLERNFEESDWELIEAATEKKLDDYEYHFIQSSVRDVFEAHPHPKAIKSLLNLYEYGVCSRCRFRILEHLVSLEALPESIQEECFHDSNSDIQEWAKNGFKLERS